MSKLIDKHSTLSSKAELDLCSVPPTQVVVKNSFLAEVHLQNPCTHGGPYEFRIPADAYMLNLEDNFLYARVRIVRADGTPIVRPQAAQPNALPNPIPAIIGDTVAPINLLGKTFYKQIQLFLGSKLVFDSGDKYAYRAFLETELNYSRESKATQLQMALYSKDRPPTELQTADNLGWAARRESFVEGGWVEMAAPIHADLFMQNRYLINQTELRMKVWRNSDAFCLMTIGAPAHQYKIEVDRMIFYVRKVEVADNFNLAIDAALTENASVKYPIRRIQMSHITITDNRRTTPLNSLFTGTLPRRIVLGMVAAEAMLGTYNTSPFNFQPFSIRQIAITCGTTTIPATPYDLDFANNQFLRAYIQLFRGMGMYKVDRSNAIDVGSFKSGCTLFVFELGPDSPDSGGWDLAKEGTVSLDIQFGAALPAGGVEVIVYAENDSLLMIDRARQVFMDYTV